MTFSAFFFFAFFHCTVFGLRGSVLTDLALAADALLTDRYKPPYGITLVSCTVSEEIVKLRAAQAMVSLSRLRPIQESPFLEGNYPLDFPFAEAHSSTTHNISHLLNKPVTYGLTFLSLT
jgi:hypothetical protein